MGKIYNKSIKFLSCLFCCLLIFANPCQGSYLKDLESLSSLKFNQGQVRITAPYSILENTRYTPNLDVFEFEHYAIRVLNRKNPEKFILEIEDNLKNVSLNKNQEDIYKRLPWWSKSAPQGLKTLDFSQVDGKLEKYKLSENYQLKLVERQGAWGKVYILEHCKKGKEPIKICAVKLLLTRKNESMKVEEFRKRHYDEIKNTFTLSDKNIDIGIEPYGILKNDEDHYLIFLEYGENAHSVFKQQPLSTSVNALYDFIFKVNEFHARGYAHGDLKIDNMLLVNHKIKLCDWFSLSTFKDIELKKYRYIGDNLPPEALRALYFRKDENLLYSIITEKNQEQSYFLHPIAADRFCLGISLLELLAPDLYQEYDKLMTQGFNPWKPESLDFWEKHVNYIRNTQSALLKRASKIDDWKLAQLYKQVHQFICLDPMKRKFILSKTEENS